MQAKPDAEELAKIGEVLGLQSLKEEVNPQWWPMRGGLGSTPPTDPVIYRLYEVGETTTQYSQILTAVFAQGVLVYGHAIKVRLGTSSCSDEHNNVDFPTGYH